MKKNEENRKTMYEAVLTLLESNSQATATIPAFAASETALKNVVTALEAKALEFNHASVGKAGMKNEAAQSLIDALMPMVSALSVYAVKQKNVELQQKSDLTHTYLLKQRDTELVIEANGIVALVNANIAGLADCGITPQKVTDLQAKINTYDGSIGGRESSHAERVGARESLTGLFKEADRILAEEIDNYMGILKPDHLQLYDEYQSARAVKNVGIRHRKPAQSAGVPVNGTHAAVSPTN